MNEIEEGAGTCPTAESAGRDELADRFHRRPEYMDRARDALDETCEARNEEAARLSAGGEKPRARPGRDRQRTNRWASSPFESREVDDARSGSPIRMDEEGRIASRHEPAAPARGRGIRGRSNAAAAWESARWCRTPARDRSRGPHFSRSRDRSASGYSRNRPTPRWRRPLRRRAPRAQRETPWNQFSHATPDVTNLM